MILFSTAKCIKHILLHLILLKIWWKTAKLLKTFGGKRQNRKINLVGGFKRCNFGENYRSYGRKDAPIQAKDL